MPISVYPAPVPMTYAELVRRGKVDGASIVHKFGRNNSAANATWEHIWIAGGIYVFPTVGSNLEIVSTSANDTSAGSGAREVTVEGLDASLNEITGTFATNGTTAVSNLLLSFFRVNRAFVSEAGTYNGANEGDITVRITGGGATQALIGTETSRGLGQSQLARYTVPVGKVAYVRNALASVDSDQSSDLAFYRREDSTDVTAPVESRRLINYFDGISGQLNFLFQTEMGPFSAGTDLWWEVLAGQINTEVSVDFEMIIENA